MDAHAMPMATASGPKPMAHTPLQQQLHRAKTNNNAAAHTKEEQDQAGAAAAATASFQEEQQQRRQHQHPNAAPPTTTPPSPALAPAPMPTDDIAAATAAHRSSSASAGAGGMAKPKTQHTKQQPPATTLSLPPLVQGPVQAILTLTIGPSVHWLPTTKHPTKAHHTQRQKQNTPTHFKLKWWGANAEHQAIYFTIPSTVVITHKQNNKHTTPRNTKTTTNEKEKSKSAAEQEQNGPHASAAAAAAAAHEDDVEHDLHALYQATFPVRCPKANLAHYLRDAKKLVFRVFKHSKAAAATTTTNERRRSSTATPIAIAHAELPLQPIAQLLTAAPPANQPVADLQTNIPICRATRTILGHVAVRVTIDYRKEDAPDAAAAAAAPSRLFSASRPHHTTAVIHHQMPLSEKKNKSNKKGNATKHTDKDVLSIAAITKKALSLRGDICDALEEPALSDDNGMVGNGKNSQSEFRTPSPSRKNGGSIAPLSYRSMAARHVSPNKQQRNDSSHGHHDEHDDIVHARMSRRKREFDEEVPTSDAYSEYVLESCGDFESIDEHLERSTIPLAKNLLEDAFAQAGGVDDAEGGGDDEAAALLQQLFFDDDGIMATAPRRAAVMAEGTSSALGAVKAALEPPVHGALVYLMVRVRGAQLSGLRPPAMDQKRKAASAPQPRVYVCYRLFGDIERRMTRVSEPTPTPVFADNYVVPRVFSEDLLGDIEEMTLVLEVWMSATGAALRASPDVLIGLAKIPLMNLAEILRRQRQLRCDVPDGEKNVHKDQVETRGTVACNGVFTVHNPITGREHGTIDVLVAGGSRDAVDRVSKIERRIIDLQRRVRGNLGRKKARRVYLETARSKNPVSGMPGSARRTLPFRKSTPMSSASQKRMRRRISHSGVSIRKKIRPRAHRKNNAMAPAATEKSDDLTHQRSTPPKRASKLRHSSSSTRTKRVSSALNTPVSIRRVAKPLSRDDPRKRLDLHPRSASGDRWHHGDHFTHGQSQLQNSSDDEHVQGKVKITVAIEEAFLQVNRQRIDTKTKGVPRIPNSSLPPDDYVFAAYTIFGERTPTLSRLHGMPIMPISQRNLDRSEPFFVDMKHSASFVVKNTPRFRERLRTDPLEIELWRSSGRNLGNSSTGELLVGRATVDLSPLLPAAEDATLKEPVREEAWLGGVYHLDVSSPQQGLGSDAIAVERARIRVRVSAVAVQPGLIRSPSVTPSKKVEVPRSSPSSPTKDEMESFLVPPATPSTLVERQLGALRGNKLHVKIQRALNISTDVGDDSSLNVYCVFYITRSGASIGHLTEAEFSRCSSTRMVLRSSAPSWEGSSFITLPIDSAVANDLASFDLAVEVRHRNLSPKSPRIGADGEMAVPVTPSLGDILIGICRVGLVTLTCAAMSEVDGWYHVSSSLGSVRGQLKVCIRPDADVAHALALRTPSYAQRRSVFKRSTEIETKDSEDSNSGSAKHVEPPSSWVFGGDELMAEDTETEGDEFALSEAAVAAGIDMPDFVDPNLPKEEMLQKLRANMKELDIINSRLADLSVGQRPSSRASGKDKEEEQLGSVLGSTGASAARHSLELAAALSNPSSVLDAAHGEVAQATVRPIISNVQENVKPNSVASLPVSTGAASRKRRRVVHARAHFLASPPKFRYADERDEHVEETAPRSPTSREPLPEETSNSPDKPDVLREMLPLEVERRQSSVPIAIAPKNSSQKKEGKQHITEKIDDDARKNASESTVAEKTKQVVAAQARTDTYLLAPTIGADSLCVTVKDSEDALDFDIRLSPSKAKSLKPQRVKGDVKSVDTRAHQVSTPTKGEEMMSRIRARMRRDASRGTFEFPSSKTNNSFPTLSTCTSSELPPLSPAQPDDCETIDAGATVRGASVCRGLFTTEATDTELESINRLAKIIQNI